MPETLNGTTTARASTPGYVNAADGLNLRAGPGIDHDVRVALPFGSELTILGEEGEWLLVTVGEQRGWVYATLVSRHPPGDNSGTVTTSFTGPLAPATPLDPPPNASPHTIGAATTWNQYGGLIEAECRRLALDPAVAVAILGVESSGRAFEGDRMIIRFENHLFLRYWGREHRAIFDRHFTGSSDGSQHRWRPDPNRDWLPCHTNQASEWQVFDFARSLDEKAAMYSISMGAAQIMGFNHNAMGYPTVQAMFEAFQTDVRNQLAALFRFIEVNHLQEAVRQANFIAFARTYNGQGQEEIYAPRMQRYYDAYRQLVGAATREHGEAAARLPQPGAPTLANAGPELPGDFPMSDSQSLAQPHVSVPSTPDVEQKTTPRGVRPSTNSQPEPTGRLPEPKVHPHSGETSGLVRDPELYAAWKTHIETGFANNQLMFQQLLNGFMNPYWTTVWMYRILFGLGVAAFLMAAGLSVFTNKEAYALVFGGLSALSLLAYFFNRPLQALEENLQFITWLGLIYNSYWTRLVYLDSQPDVQKGLQDATDDAIERIKELMEVHANRAGKRVKFPEG